MTEVEAQNAELLRAYALTFNSAAGQTVFLDLMRECKFRASIDNPTDEGKRRVFLRIMNFLNFTPEQLAVIYRGRPAITPQESDDG